MTRPWLEQVSLHPDVLSESFSEDIFALDLGTLADYLVGHDLGTSEKDLPRVPVVYRDPESFFRASYLTTGLRSLLADVLTRLSGGEGNRVLKLVTPFGGGKSHTMAALLHAARNRAALNVIPEATGLPDPGKVRVAVFDGQFFSPTNGKPLPGTDLKARTIWGWMAWCLGGRDGYEMLRVQDEMRVAPGGDDLLALLHQGSNLILLDEVLEYLISIGGIKVEKTNLRDETLSFVKRLTVAVGNVSNTALVFSLQSSKREALEHLALLQTVDHLAARKDQRREPVEGNEILSVVQRRLLARDPDAEASGPAATAYQDVLTNVRRAWARTDAERSQAEQEGIELRDRIRRSYPFHPSLIDLMRERWAALPDFQRTRGALRFLAACLRAAHRKGRSGALLGPGDVPLDDAEARQAFFKEVGQKEDFQACLEHDFIGSNSRARRIDSRREKETPSEAGKRPATRLATAILMYSFGGLRRAGGQEGDLLPPGIQEEELLRVCVGPDLDSTTAQACLKELREQCLYLHFDGVRYCFKKDPNVTLLVEQEVDAVARNEKRVTEEIKKKIEERLGGARNAIVWPGDSAKIDDNDPSFLIAYMPLDFGRKGVSAEEEAVQYFESCGSRPRNFRNGLSLAIPNEEQIEGLRRAVRYLMAIEAVQSKAKQLNLTDPQKDQLREKRSTEEGTAESALLKLYMDVWLPRIENGNMAVEKVAAGGRPLKTTLDEKRRARIHARVVELITETHRRVFSDLKAPKLVEFFKLGEEGTNRHGIRVADVVSGMFSYLGFTRIQDTSAVRRTVQEGVERGLFGYATGRLVLGEDGKYQIDRAKVAFERSLAPDEIDLDSGFLMVPEAIPAAQASVVPPMASADAGGEEPDVDRGAASAGISPLDSPQRVISSQTEIVLEFTAGRSKLFQAWNALANLADIAGEVKITAVARSEDGLDRNRLENGVLEPLREIDLIE